MLPQIDPSVEIIRHCFFDEYQEATVFCNSDGVVIVANEAFCVLFKYDKKDLLGQLLHDLVLPDQGSYANPYEWHAAHEIRNVYTRRVQQGGTIIDVYVSVVPHESELPALTGRFITYRQKKEYTDHDERGLVEEAKYRSIFENAAEGIFITTVEGQYLDVNPALAKIYGFADPSDMIEHFDDIKQQLYVDPSRRDAFVRILKREGNVTGFESRVRKKNGEIIWITENARAVCDEQGAVKYYEGTVLDISDRKWVEKNLEIQTSFFSQLFSNSPQAIIVVDRQRNMMRCNKGFENLFGYKSDDIVGYGMRAYIVPDDLLGECESIWDKIIGGETIECETTRLHQNGTSIPVSLVGFPIRTDDNIHAVTYIYKDISERKSFEEQILHQAFHDSLTGLPNRSLFNERLDQALKRSKRHPDTLFSVLLLDLNKFKSVNDSMGHLVGDKLLKEVAHRLSLCVRGVDTVARLGGDEFAIILEEFTFTEDILNTTQRMESSLGKPFLIDNHEIRPGVSIGILLDIRNYSSKEDVLRDVDIAMYRAKQQKESCVVFDKKMHNEVLESINLEGELQNAIINKEFLLHYQPIISLKNHKVVCLEALARWNHPVKGIIPPDCFIPLAEETGLIVEIGKWVVSEACKNLKHWQQQGKEAEKMSVSVNVSTRQFIRPGLVQHVKEALTVNDLDPSCLKIEVTESVIMQDVEHTVAELKKLGDLGVEVALDDFGTGYSSLSYLHKMPIQYLKIDRSFVNELDKVGDNLQIVKSIISLAKTLRVKVVAEGVEHLEQQNHLSLLGCNYGQGYLFSRPVEQSKVLSLIKQFSG